IPMQPSPSAETSNPCPSVRFSMPPPCQTERRLGVSYDPTMSDYTIQNIKDLEDSAVKFGLSPQVEARFGRNALDAQKSGFSYQRFSGGLPAGVRPRARAAGGNVRDRLRQRPHQDRRGDHR